MEDEPKKPTDSDEPVDEEMEDDAQSVEETDESIEVSSTDEEQAVAQADVLLDGARAKHQNEHASLKKKIIVALIVALIVATAGFAYMLYSENDTDDSANTETTQDADENTNQDEVVAKDFDQIVYAHAGAQNTARNLFSRPATGGDRIDLEFNFGNQPLYYKSVSGSGYAIVTDDEVYYADGVEQPRLVYTSPSDHQITGLSLDNQAQSILVSSVTTSTDLSEQTSHATVINLQDDASSELFTRDDLQGGIYAEKWNGTTQTLIARISCVNCDGYGANLFSFDSQGNENEITKEGDVISNTYGYTFNSDGTQALYSVAKDDYTDQEVNQNGLQGGIGDPQGAPYDIMMIDLTNGTITKVVTVGEIEDVNDDGFFTDPHEFWATNENGDEVPAYSYLDKLFVQNLQGNFDNWFETGSGDIMSIIAVDADELLVGAEIDGGQRISYYNIEKGEGAVVMETLPTTTILNITYK